MGIVAPASPIERDQLECGCAALRALGYRPVYNNSILAADLYFAGTAQRRARELEEMFARDDVRGIVCARGGYGCNYLLPHLDVEIIRRNPKVFVGYSDVTTLLTWFHDATGLVTFHGPMAAKDFAKAHGVDEPSWRAAVEVSSGLQNAALLRPIVSGRAEGKLYGGCLSMLVASIGTAAEVRTEGTILLIEDVAVRPYQVDRMLMQLKLSGKLAGVRGIVFGCMKNCTPPPGCGYTLEDVIQRVVGDLEVPVAIGLNSGHVGRGNVTVPIGVSAALVVKEKYAAVSVLEGAVGA